MRKHDILSGLFWIGIGIIFCVGALDIGLGTPKAPRGGFFPFLGGMTLISLGLILSLWSFLRPRIKDAKERIFPPIYDLRRLLGIFIAPLAYGILLERLGFLLTTFSFMVFLLAFRSPRRWGPILVVSILTCLLSYVFFVILLKVQLPQGVLRI